jgi:hypothetical protein
MLPYWLWRVKWPNVPALAPSMAPSELKNSEENSEAIDGCQQRLCSAMGKGFRHWLRKVMVANLRECYEMEIQGFGLLTGPHRIFLRLSHGLSSKRCRQLSKRALLSRGYMTGESLRTHTHLPWLAKPIALKDIRATIRGEGMPTLASLCRSLGSETAHTVGLLQTTKTPTKAIGST